ncbi:hypothetical protein ACFL2J_00350 [Candidatus Omnitrophota bacterium]
MNRVFLVLICLIFFVSSAFAQTAEETRRVEQEKRDSLSTTEELRYEKKEPSLQPSQAVDYDYFQHLLTKRVTLFSDGCKTLTILMGIGSQYPDFDSQLRFFQENSIIPKKLKSGQLPDQPLRKGLTAYMFCRALKIKGGLWMHLFGVSQRYALKELVYMSMMLPGYTRDIVTGKELILLLTQVAEYITREE